MPDKPTTVEDHLATIAALVGPYRAAKDAVHLRYDRPLPTDVVTRVVALLADRHTATT